MGADRQKILFVNRFFYPDESATSILLTDLAFHLAEQDRDVVVLCGRSNYTADHSRLAGRETVRGVTIHRIASLPIDNKSLIGRGLNFLLFHLLGFFAAQRLVKKGDILVCLTDPPLSIVPMAWAARLRGAKLIHWVQDAFPETAATLGFLSPGGVPYRLLKALRDRALRSSDTVVAIGNKMRIYLETLGVARAAITVIPNWTDDHALTPLGDEPNMLRREWGFADEDFVVGYSGNLGRAHDIDTMLDAAAILNERGADHIRFLFIGGGAKTTQVEQAKAALPQGRIVTRGYAPASQLRHSLSLPDIHWISLLPELEGHIVPSKFYGIAAVARPIMFIGASAGELGHLIHEHGCGTVIAPSDGAAVANFLIEMQSSPQDAAKMGECARTLIESEFSRVTQLQRWERLCKTLQK